ncbi:hypothetical protein F66182_8267 [Fusarium sp. NRRL 66182]|nr:hypothetical protein F66182_8267 [Fusarium sp. NRRL 66182]
MEEVPPSVMRAFGVATRPKRIEGGRGLCFHAADTILRPSDDNQESDFVAEMCKSITALKPTEYRLSFPLQTVHPPSTYIYQGWTAWTFVSGEAAPKGKFEIILKTCRAFTAHLGKLHCEKPEFLSTRQNRFTEADLVTWEEKTLDEVDKISTDILSRIQPTLQQLVALRKPLQNVKNQLIHGDLTGNILFDPMLPPGIIDITLYWRPAEYAEAIIVADGLMWLDQGRELLETYGTDQMRMQLLHNQPFMLQVFVIGQHAGTQHPYVKLTKTSRVVLFTPTANCQLPSFITPAQISLDQHGRRSQQSRLQCLPKGKEEGVSFGISQDREPDCDKCDLAQPNCGRCAKLGTACVGSGARRFKFQQYRPDTQLVPTPATIPSNGTSRLAASFVALMEIEDERYDFQFYGPHFFADLPRRLGSSSALDASTSALIAAFKSIRLRRIHDRNVFALYGKALRALQGFLGDAEQPPGRKMEVVCMMMLCQLWIDNKQANKHRGVLAYLLKEAVSQGQKIATEDLRAWCLQAIYAALVDPKVELGSWFWEVALQDTVMARPYHYGANLYSHELGPIAELTVFLRDPEKYLYQLKCYYNIITQERPVMRELYEQAMVPALRPDADRDSKRRCIEYAAGYAGILVQAALIGPTLAPFGVHPEYTQDSHEICDEAISLAEQCQTYRPCGASYVPELLKLVWASLGDEYRHEEIEKLLVLYGEDVQGANYVQEARDIRSRYERLGWSNKQRFLTGSEDGDAVQEAPPCVIL